MGTKRKHQPAHGSKPQKKPRRGPIEHFDKLKPKPQHSSPPSFKRRSSKKARRAGTQPQHLKPVIPFSPHHAILCVGEGDLSFAASLATHHGCTDLRAAVLEKSCDELLTKYPHAAPNVAAVEGIMNGGGKVLFGADVTKMAPFVVPNGRKRRKGKDKEQKSAGKPQPDGGDSADRNELGVENSIANESGGKSDRYGTDEEDEEENDNYHSRISVKPPGSPLLDRIIFNFPHVGGKSTDVNRQVRANQSLLVGFFERCLPSLAPGGRIIVTLFEGDPYSLWNIKDLGRHCGLAVERSFGFRAEAYPGYRHARTLGVVRKGGAPKGAAEGGEEEDDAEESTTAWKGEERRARSYVFVRKGDEVVARTELGGGIKEDGDKSSDEGEE